MKFSKILLIKAFVIVAGSLGTSALMGTNALATDNFINRSGLSNAELDKIELASCDYDEISNKVNLNNLRNALNSY